MKPLFVVLISLVFVAIIGCGNGQQEFSPKSNPVNVWVHHDNSIDLPEGYFYTDEFELNRHEITSSWLDSLISDFNNFGQKYGEEVVEVQLLLRLNDSVSNFYDVNHDRYVCLQKVAENDYRVRRMDWGPWNMGYEKGKFKNFSPSLPTLVAEANEYAKWWSEGMSKYRSGHTTYQPLVVRLILKKSGEFTAKDFHEITIQDDLALRASFDSLSREMDLVTDAGKQEY